METLINNIDNETIVIVINNGVYLTPNIIMRRFSLWRNLTMQKLLMAMVFFALKK